MKFKDHVDRLRSLKRRLAIWEAIHHLMDDKFIAKDGKSKVSGIREPESNEIVPEDEIEDVLRNIAEGPITEIRAEIASLESGEVVILGEKKASA